MESVIKEYWALFAAGIGHLIWLVRLESRAHTNSKNQAEDRKNFKEVVEKMEQRWSEQRKEDLATLFNQRKEDAESRRRDWEALRADISEVKGDIKELLLKVS